MPINIPILLMINLLLNACDFADRSQPSIHQQENAGPSNPAAKGKFVIATKNSPTSYYYNQDNKRTGFEFELVEQFAGYYGKKIEYKVYDTVSEILDAVERKAVDFAAAGLSKTENRAKEFLFTSSYFKVQPKIACHDKAVAKNMNHIVDNTLVVSSGTSYIDLLQTWRQKLPSLQWQEDAELSSEEILYAIDQYKIDCTVIDSNIFALSRPYLKNVRAMFDIGDPRDLAWIIHPEKTQIQQLANRFLSHIQKNGSLKILQDKYYGFVKEYDFYDNKVFMQRIHSRLPQYLDILKQASDETGYSLPFLAAISYQESHWNPKARSRTGVRGFMMLTQATAKEMGVKNRLDPKASMLAGARYLKALEAKFPYHISKSNRLFFALASYNQGYYHLQDARALAVYRQRNANEWASLREILPLLMRKKHYKHTRYGYSRGVEAVSYVDHIRQYQRILEREIPILLASQTPSQRSDKL